MNWLKKLILSIQENKILQKKIKDVNKKVTDNSKFIVCQVFNRLTKVNFNARTAEASKKFGNKKVENTYDIGGNNSKKRKNLQKFDLSYFIGKHYFNDDGSQNPFIFQPVFKYF